MPWEDGGVQGHSEVQDFSLHPMVGRARESATDSRATGCMRHHLLGLVVGRCCPLCGVMGAAARVDHGSCCGKTSLAH
eukprot:15239589-Alexandrium_andersonii.AAC.1